MVYGMWKASDEVILGLIITLQLEKEIPDPDMAVQFLGTVCGDRDMDSRPKQNPSITSLHEYTLKCQIRETAQVGKDSGVYRYTTARTRRYLLFAFSVGFLQILFMAGAVEHPIQQHCSVPGQDLYKLLIPPCACNVNWKSTLHIMWLGASTSTGPPNHLIPLISKSELINHYGYNWQVKWFYS